MHKIGVIGDKDSVLGFKAIGLYVYPVTSSKQAEDTLKKLAHEDFAVILITEQVAMQIPETIDRYKTTPFPAVIPIPNNSGSTGFGMKNVKANVEKAIGSDIIFNDK